MVQIRAQAVLQGGSGLPRDQYVNVFHFVTAGSSFETDGAAVAAQLVTRYQAIQSYLSEYVANAAQIKVYNLADAEPRQPMIVPLPLTVPTDQPSMPSEVAVCLSFRGEPPNTARRRGRVYLGPLNTSCMTLAVKTEPPRPHDGFVQQIRNFGLNLLGANLGWCIWSPTTSSFVPVDSGWCDDEFDTMRSRGQRPTTRHSF